MNGIGTLLFIFITKGKAPTYLGSSFAFIAPANIIIAKFGYPYACGGFVVVGFCGCLLAMIIKKFGTKWIDIVLPSAAMGPVVALIGLELSSSLCKYSFGILGDNIDPKNVIVFAVTLGMAVIGSVCFKKFLSVIPILIAVVTGYLTAFCRRHCRLYSCIGSKLYFNSKLSSTKIQYRCHSNDASCIISYHIGTHWSPNRYRRSCRKKLNQRSRTTSLFICR